MKKIVVLLLLIAVASLTFADDALVLPKGVLRVYVTGAYGFATSTFDQDAKKQDISGLNEGYKFINLGGAIEFGVTDWVSAAVQWAPGWNIWSEFDNPTLLLDDNARINGPFDIFAGAKIQVIGKQGLMPNEMIRLAFAPGVKIALPDPDWSEQANNKADGDPWKAQSVDKHAWGFGARAYFDYVLNQMIYFNLYSEFIYFLKKDYDDTDLYGGFGTDAEFEYGYDLTLEAEPHFETMVADGLRLGIAVPATITMSPEVKIDGVGQDDASYLFSVGPNVSLFLMNFFIPMELKLGYTLPLLGKNADAVNTVVFQLKVYYARR
jgi:hypothetical protein